MTDDKVEILPEEVKIEPFTEFETKYETEFVLQIPFKELVETFPDLIRFEYVQGPDTYYTKKSGVFGRHRFSQYPDINGERFNQWTVKTKPDGAKNNIKRKEPNWNLSNTPEDEVVAGAIEMGYEFNFKIWKMCHIYTFPDATVVFYTTRNEKTKKYQHFIEIEVEEKTIHELTEEQAWAIIVKYEKLLEPVGVKPQKRLRNSLYERNVEEI